MKASDNFLNLRSDVCRKVRPPDVVAIDFVNVNSGCVLDSFHHRYWLRPRTQRNLPSQGFSARRLSVCAISTSLPVTTFSLNPSHSPQNPISPRLELPQATAHFGAENFPGTPSPRKGFSLGNLNAFPPNSSHHSFSFTRTTTSLKVSRTFRL